MASVDGLQRVLSFLAGLQPKVQAQIARKIFSLAANAKPSDSATLHGYPDLMRVDCGEYRIVYRVRSDEDVVEIVLVGKRNDGEVYRQLDRRAR